MKNRFGYESWGSDRELSEAADRELDTLLDDYGVEHDSDELAGIDFSAYGIKARSYDY